jgi:hypothetical protein
MFRRSELTDGASRCPLYPPKPDIAEHRRHVRNGHSTIQVIGFIIFDAIVREVAKGPGRSHADRGLKFGDCKGVIFAPGRNLNGFYEAFMTAITAFA